MYEWDEKKREANLLKHGLDFDAPILVFESPDKVTFATIRPRGAKVAGYSCVTLNGTILTLIYTARGTTCVSFRSARSRGKETHL